MKFTLSWLKSHLDTAASVADVADAMTMAGLEVEHVDDPGAKLAAFSVAKVVEAVQHPNADRLRVCQVETKDGLKEIVCGAPNARAALFTVYAPIGTYIPGSGITLEPRPVRGVVSNGMLCSAAELQTAEESDGILELAEAPVGTSAAEALGLEAVIDFEVTPNRPDWLGVAGIARDMAAAGLGTLKDLSVTPVTGKFPCPVEIRVDGSDACPAFAGRLIRGLKNGPSPAWMQDLLRAIGLRPINALVDVTNFLTYDRARPLHVYDATKLTGGWIEARLGVAGEKVAALNGKTYDVTAEMCVIADGSGPIGLGGVMGDEATGSQVGTTDVFIESAWFDPIRTAQTGRDLALISDAQYRFARGVDPGFLVPGLELATKLIIEFCGGEASEISLAGELPAPPPAIAFDPAYVKRLAGIELTNERIRTILETLGFRYEADRVLPPSWRRDVEGRADLVEEVARIAGYDNLPSEPLPPMARPASGVLTLRQSRIRAARRALAAAGYAEALTNSFVGQGVAKLFGGGDESLVLANPISSDLDCMRPSGLPSLIEAAGRNARRGFPDCALFEIGPVFAGTEPGDERTVIAAIIAPHGPRRWGHGAAEDVFAIKADLMALLDDLGAPTANLQVAQDATRPWWRPGRAARLQLGPKAVLAEFGEIHPKVLAAMDVAGPVFGFEVRVEAIPEPKKKAVKTRPGLSLSPLMPLTRDFAFVVAATTPAGDITRAVQSADRVLISGVRVFDVYEGPGIEAGKKSVAVEVTVQPREKTLDDAEIEALSKKIVAAAAKSAGAVLRG
ncbi:MAG TPA: phenylalanine--tRNA ligase subunit beta [Caulobacteraceae bacterium]|jgi:phenylalanyl-tRNA synthetase beta chain